ncbi:MAG: PP2C family protein-serine/threonine phosphatase, partial [Phycisphaerales bacterium]
EVVGRSAASSEMGGDLIDLVATPDRLDVYLADVSGHGVKAGVVMAMLKSSLRMRLLRPADLGEVLTDLNRVLESLVEPGMFATASCLRVRADRSCEVAMAGHLPLVCWRAGERRIELIDNEHLPLGVEGGHEFHSRTVAAAAGDVFMLLTDGLTEVQDGGGKELGMEPVVAAFAAAAGGGGTLVAMHAAVLARAAGHGRQIDDQTLVMLRVL